jgi:hypothetical protein
MPPSSPLTAALKATWAAENAARRTAVKSQTAKNIAASPADAITFCLRLVDQRTTHEQGGPLLRSLCSPRLFFAFVNSSSIQRREVSLQESSIEEPMMPTSVSRDATVTARRSPRPLPSLARRRRPRLR